MIIRLTPLLLTLTLATLTALAANAASVDVQIEEPRAFAHFVGDVVERRLTITAPRPLLLAMDSIPKPGRLGYAFELREANLTSKALTAGTRYELQLRYQIFVAPIDTKTLDLPAFVLQFDGGTRPEELRINFAPVSIARQPPSWDSLFPSQIFRERPRPFPGNSDNLEKSLAPEDSARPFL